MAIKEISLSDDMKFRNRYINQFIQLMRDTDAPHPCFLNALYNCIGDSIRSHVISRSLLEKYYSRSGQTYMPIGNFSTLKKTNGKIVYKPVGINKASVFYGFCRHHDSVVFKEIDEVEWLPSEKQVILAYYRSIAFELYQKVRACIEQREAHDLLAAHLSDVEKERGGESEIQASSFLKNAFVHSTGVMDLLPEFECLQEHIVKAEFSDKIHFVSWNTRNILPVVCFGVFSPMYDITGKMIQDHSDLDTPLQSVFLALTPTENGGRITAAYLSSDGAAAMFIDSMRRANRRHLPDIAVKLVFEHCENHCCSPDWIDNLSPQKTGVISDHLHQLHPRIINYEKTAKILNDTASYDKHNSCP